MNISGLTGKHKRPCTFDLKKFVFLNGPSINHQEIKLNSISKGDFILKSEILDNAKGFIRDSCEGSVVANVFFGEAGVGKSTVSSLGKCSPLCIVPFALLSLFLNRSEVISEYIDVCSDL